MATTGTSYTECYDKKFIVFLDFFNVIYQFKVTGRSHQETTTLSTIFSKWIANCFITRNLPTAITVCHWKAQNEIKKGQIWQELLPPSAHLLLIICIKRMQPSHADPVMWRGWISFTARKVSLGFSCDSHELLISTTDGHPPLSGRKVWSFPDVS